MSNIDINNSTQNYDSTLAPFFRNNYDSDVEDIDSESIINVDKINLINKFTNINLPIEIKNFYINNNSYNRELYIKSWTLFSIKKILDMHDNYLKDDITSIIDLGFIYLGLGWIKVAFYNTEDNMIYYRRDGGSNGWDRNANYKNLKKYDTLNKKSNGMNSDKSISFSTFLKEINEENNETDAIDY